jgi:CheY-like chemotaxis protein
MEPWRRSDLYARPSPPRACDPIELDRTIATLLLRVDLLTVTSTDDRPDAINLPSLCRPAAEDATGHHDATARQPIRVGEFTQSPRILIVDDVPAMRAALRGLLEDADLPVIGEASDGLQAVSRVAELKPDVVVMDLRMPGLDGLQATKRITSANPHVQVVVYSAFDSDGTQQAARQAGATAFVVKGGPPNQVQDTVLAAWQAAHNPASSDPGVE